MTIDHFSLAVDGLTPNFKHYTFSVLGRRVSVSIVPKRKTQGGGSHGKKLEPDYYEVTVKVIYKERVWIQRKNFSKTALKRFEKVMATFKYITSIPEQVMLYVDLIKAKIIDKKISINIQRIHKDK